jgi:hypothetical protein
MLIKYIEYDNEYDKNDMLTLKNGKLLKTKTVDITSGNTPLT